MRAIWTEDKAELKEEDYRDFYRFIANAFDDPVYRSVRFGSFLLFFFLFCRPSLGLFLRVLAFFVTVCVCFFFRRPRALVCLSWLFLRFVFRGLFFWGGGSFRLTQAPHIISHHPTPNRLHFRTDAPLDLKVLFFVPSFHGEKFGMGRLDPGVSLYSRKVGKQHTERQCMCA